MHASIAGDERIVLRKKRRKELLTEQSPELPAVGGGGARRWRPPVEEGTPFRHRSPGMGFLLFRPPRRAGAFDQFLVPQENAPIAAVGVHDVDGAVLVIGQVLEDDRFAVRRPD